MSGAPLTDRRRASALHDALAEMVPWLTPEWAGLGQDGDFGRALYQIAARFGEHVTRRLDETALRDKLAFLDRLDIAAPAPRSATVPIVFTLAEKRSEPVYAPRRVQIAAAVGDEPVMFETQEALLLTPARTLRLIAADPAADRIELAPAEVIAPPQPPSAPVTYRLVSAAEADGTMLQLAQSVGLGAGDLVRIGAEAYRIEKKAEEIVTLLDPLKAPAPVGTRVEKVTKLESFTLHNLSEHSTYVGHKQLLKLDGRATIALRLDPPSLASRLARLDIAYDLWGKPNGDEKADWQPLRLLGSSNGELRLLKEHPGAVEEVEVEGRKNRWVRLRLRTPVADSAPPDTRAASVTLKVSSNPPAAAASGGGSGSIVSAFYNGLPLSLTTAFLPFGPEPQRFDTFAIAAPEALSKKGATVDLAVKLSDASLGAITVTEGAPERVYGIGRNGRLQAIRFRSPEAPAWRQLDRPPAATGATGGSADAAASVLALHSSADPTNDLVLVADAAKNLWLAQVAAQGTERAARRWSRIDPERQEPPASLILLGDAAGGPPSIVASDSAGLYRRTIDLSALTLGKPEDLAPSGSAGPRHPLVLAPVRGAQDRLVAVDQDGKLFEGTRVANAIAWREALAGVVVKRSVKPAAYLDDGVLTVAAAAESGILLLRGGKDCSPAPDVIGEPIAFACLAEAPGRPFPLLAAVGEKEVLIWADETPAPPALLPPSAGGAVCVALRPEAGAASPSLLIAAPEELLFEAPVKSETGSFPIARFDALWLGQAAKALYFQQAGSAPQPLPAERIGFKTDTAVPVELGFQDQSLALLIPDGMARKGARVPGEPRQLVLDDDDSATSPGDLIEIGKACVEVTAIVTDEGRRIAAFADDLPKSFTIYRGVSKSGPVTIATKDRGTLLRLSGASFPKTATAIRFVAPAAPAKQTFARAIVAPPGETWLYLAQAWTKTPDAPSMMLPSLTGVSDWSEVRLPRSTENPELSWEYFDGRGWRRLEAGFNDGTANLASTGSIRFTVPPDLAPTDVAGKQDYWIRARLAGGDYGRPSYSVETVGNRQSIRIDRSTLNPPEIVSIEASYDLHDYVPPQIVLTVNNLAPIDQTQAAAAAGAEFDLFEGLAAHTSDVPGLGRAIYLGLSRAPGVDPLSLYADAADLGSAAVRLQAEALRPEGWKPIVCDDGTAGLARPGLLRLILSTPPEQLPLFGCDGWWLRLRPRTPSAGWAPVLRGLYLNAVMAEQAKTLQQEILGSSLGAPDQSYRLAEAPVLPETLELRVRELLSDEEKTALRSLDPDAVASCPDVEGEWIRWRATDSFAGQDGGARVFRLDPSSGEVSFGNGRDGRIPPAGRDSIRAFFYQTGGGSRGNVPAFAVKQLKTALESVELAVNPVDSGGGADAPPQDQLAVTAPDRLRHATRALAASDVEALARSSPDVVRARCLRGRGCGIELVVAIRMAGERCPVPSRARREGIARNIAAAAWGALAPDSIRVHPPRYVHLKVEAVAIARSLGEVAQIEKDGRKAILDFLHPTDGGSGGRGWPFARRPWPSDLQRVLGAVAGVDRVVHSVVTARDRADLDRLSPDALICVEEKDIGLLVQAPGSAR